MSGSANLATLMYSVISRYSDRYKEFGTGVRTLGWGSVEQQKYRFVRAIRSENFCQKSVLDIGCGFGDFYLACRDEEADISRYTGWDINQELIFEAKKRHPDASFDVVDLASLDDITIQADIGVMLGVLNLNFKDDYDNIAFSRMMIEKAFYSISKSLIVDFLSLHKSLDYPSEDFVFYHDPSEMLSFALTLTPNVRLFHDYSPIPQKEFMLVLEHV